MTTQFPFPFGQLEQHDRPAPAMNYEIVSHMPWLVAEPHTMWSASGRTLDGNRFVNELAIVMPWQRDDDEHPVFALFSPGEHAWSYPTDHWNNWLGGQLIPADRIDRAERLTLVMADNPTEAYFLAEQNIIDAGKDHR